MELPSSCAGAIAPARLVDWLNRASKFPECSRRAQARFMRASPGCARPSPRGIEHKRRLPHVVHSHTDSGHCRRSEEHTSELQSLMRISYAVFCLKKKTQEKNIDNNNNHIQHTYTFTQSL